MKKSLMSISLVLVSVALVSCARPGATTSNSNAIAVPTLTKPAATAVPVAAPATDTTVKVVAATEAFLATLDDAQKKAVMFEYTDSTQRAKWSNFPTGLFQRAGLRMGDLSQAQQDAVFATLATILSAKGYQQAVDEVNGDEVLKGQDGGGNLIFGKAEYYVSILGTPSTTTPWMLQFGGHHLAINATVVGENITLAPSLTGGQPVNYTLAGKTVRQAGDESDKAFALIGLLDADQKKLAVLGSASINAVLGPGEDGKTIQPEGIKVSALNEAQQAALLALVGERVNWLNDEDAALKMAEVKANLAETYFAWYGPTTNGSAAYWRVQGPTLFMEFSPQSMGGDATNHLHNMFRDPTNDYGVAWSNK
jgi:Protein of unknown function (DUF3500)